MTKIKVELGILKVAKNVIQQLQLTEEHNKFVILQNLKKWNPILDDNDDDLKYKNIELAEVNDKGHILKDDKGNLIFNRDNTIEIEKYNKINNKKIIEVDVIKFRNNDEIQKLPIGIKSYIDFMLIEMIEPKETKKE